MKTLRYLIPALLLVVGAAYLYLRPDSLTMPGRPVPEPSLNATAPPSALLSTGISKNATPPPVAPVGGSSKLADPSLAGSVSRDALDQFVTANGRSALSLIAAWSESRDRMWLREAAEKSPNEPAVQYLVLMAEVYPAQRSAWLARLRAAAPQNGLADFLQAADLLHAGDRDGAFAALRAGVAKPAFDDYALEMLAARQSLMTAAIRDPLEAGIRAMSGVPLESIPLIFKTANEVLAEQKTALQQTDFAAANAAALLSVQIGRALNNPKVKSLLIEQLAGMSIEQRALIALSSAPGAAAALGFDPEDRLAQLQTERDEVKSLTALLAPGHLNQFTPFVPGYFRRVQDEGELAALRWLAGTKGR